MIVMLVSVARLRDLLPAAARALALPRVRRRPRLGGADRTPQRARLGAAEDQRHDGARAQPGPAHGGRDERLLHRPGAHEEVADEHLRRPPAAGAAPGGAGAAGVPAAGHRLSAVGLRDILTGRHAGQGPRARPPVRDLHGLRHARRPSTRSTRRAPRRSSSRRSRRASSKRRCATWKRSSRRPAARAARACPPRTTATATAGWCCATPPARRAWKTSRSASTRCPARSRRPATASGCCARCSPSPTRTSSADLLHLQLQARLLVPVRARRRPSRSSARPSASCRSRRRWPRELPIEPELERWFPLWGIPI